MSSYSGVIKQLNCCGMKKTESNRLLIYESESETETDSDKKGTPFVKNLSLPPNHIDCVSPLTDKEGKKDKDKDKHKDKDKEQKYKEEDEEETEQGK